MMRRLLEGAHIEAADQSHQALVQNVQKVAAEGKLAVPAQAAADLVWASANTAAWLYVTAQSRKAPPPEPDVIDLIRESVMQIILSPSPDADSK
ncbi:hypothetical protein OMP38_33215 [Cohnella ginsengisoli]|uniref:Uncharacterized protein n=1 Tax=Cohnella ginsengisoli TaxID=425004 RepID=A0A9X4KNC7_9BACL|nr:hypothetical protein [Cohnella ginsengisoli]MDG0795145.1 hypothetical protein [Cohnella ginsengisoli]